MTTSKVFEALSPSLSRERREHVSPQEDPSSPSGSRPVGVPACGWSGMDSRGHQVTAEWHPFGIQGWGPQLNRTDVSGELVTRVLLPPDTETSTPPGAGGESTAQLESDMTAASDAASGSARTSTLAPSGAVSRAAPARGFGRGCVRRWRLIVGSSLCNGGAALPATLKPPLRRRPSDMPGDRRPRKTPTVAPSPRRGHAVALRATATSFGAVEKGA